MPYVTIDQIKPYISPALYSALGKEISTGVTYFSRLELEASAMINKITGVAIPATAGSLAWAVLPAAYIIKKLAIELLTNSSPEYIARVDNEFLLAKELLAERVNEGDEDATPPDRSSSFKGSIEGVEVW